MRSHIIDYIESKANAWTAPTIRSEKARLFSVEKFIDGNPETLWAHLEDKGLAPYTRKTVFIRVSNFWDSFNPTTLNPYKKWMQTHARLFKHVYTKKPSPLTYKEALEAIYKIQNPKVQKKAFQLLVGGLRWTESFTIKDGVVTGKGGKKRRVFVEAQDFPYSYSYFVQTLRKVGLKPHDLRKIRATQLAQQGMKEADLCKVFGWESFQTASCYIQPMKDELIGEMMKEMV